MQLGQLKRLKSRSGPEKDHQAPEDILDRALIYSSVYGRSKVTEEDSQHLEAVKFIKRSLTGFELSKNEVRVYLFLARFGARKAQRIADAIGIHRTEAYKILRRLEGQGLVSCILERPMKFVASPFEKALESLIEEKRHLVHQLERRKKELMDIWVSLPKTEKVKAESETSQVLEGKRQITVKANELVQGCDREILMAVHDDNLLWLYNSPFFEELEKTSSKKLLDIRILTNFSPKSTYVLEQIDLGDSFFSYLMEEGTPGFIISDSQQMILLMEHGRGGNCKPFAMWTNYFSIIKSFRLLFTLLWEEPAPPTLQTAGAEAA